MARLEELVASLAGVVDDGESVDERTHALQCATLAHDLGVRPALLAAALFHDIARSPLVAPHYQGLSHEEAGAAFLTGLLGPEVAWLVGAHVAAKAHLVATEPGYASLLSQASIASHAHQVRRLGLPPLAHPLWADALVLRRLDDAAKDPAVRVAGPSELLAVVASLLALGPQPARGAPVTFDAQSSSGCARRVDAGSGRLPTITPEGDDPSFPTESNLEV